MNETSCRICNETLTPVIDLGWQPLGNGFLLPDQFDTFEADIVLANILANPLCQLSADISALIKPQGSLILSGILNEQAETVAHAYQQHNIQIEAPVSQEDWCRLDGIKP